MKKIGPHFLLFIFSRSELVGFDFPLLARRARRPVEFSRFSCPCSVAVASAGRSGLDFIRFWLLFFGLVVACALAALARSRGRPQRCSSQGRLLFPGVRCRSAPPKVSFLLPVPRSAGFVLVRASVQFVLVRRAGSVSQSRF
jgi:hypothetical protein